MLDPRIEKPIDALKVALTAICYGFLRSVALSTPKKKSSKFRSWFPEVEWLLKNGARIYTSQNFTRKESYIAFFPSEFSSWKAVILFLQRAAGSKDLSKLRIVEYHLKVDLVGVSTDQIIREISPLWFGDTYTFTGHVNFKKGFALKKVINEELSGGPHV